MVFYFGPQLYGLFIKPFGEENNRLSENKKYIQSRILLLYPDRNPNPLKRIRCPGKTNQDPLKNQESKCPKIINLKPS